MWQLDGKRFWSEERVVVPGDNLPEMFWNAVAQRGDLTLFRQKEYGLWQSLSWNEVGQIVREVGAGLIELGFAAGETASVLGNTRQEWLFSDLAILSCGGISSGIYPTDAASQVEYLTQDSNSVLLFVEDDEQLDKALEVRERLPALRKIIVWDMGGLRDLDDDQVISLAELREMGRKRSSRLGAAAADAEWRERIGTRKSDRTGDPDLHLGHHRPAQGCDDLARQHPAGGARLQPGHGAERGRRAHVFPAAVPCRRTRQRRLLFAVHRHQTEFCREPRDSPGERA